VTVWAGLQAASRFTLAFGDEALTRKFDEAASDIRRAALQHLWDEEQGRFLRGILFERGQRIRDATLDSSLFSLTHFGVLPESDARVTATLEAVAKRLWCRTEIGGLARYEGDYYHRVSGDLDRVPGNPWILCTLWLADWHCARATSRSELAPARALLQWTCDRALPSGVLAEQIHPHTGEPLSVSPLSWSHATLASSVHHYVERYRALARE